MPGAVRPFGRPVVLAAAWLLLPALCGCNRPPPPADVWTVHVSDRLTFTPATFACPRGRTLRIRLENTLPRRGAGLLHNLTVLMPGSDVDRFGQLAPNAGADERYIPEEFRSRVVAQTPFIGPAENTEVTLTAPDQPGEYPVVCAFPGHCLLGMRGTLVVR